MRKALAIGANEAIRVNAIPIDGFFVAKQLAEVVKNGSYDLVICGKESLDYLLFDWLKELLYYFDSEHLLFSRFQVQVTEDGLTGTAWGEPVDRDRHPLSHEVKAITYHGLRVDAESTGWLAEVIVDI